MKEEKRFYWLVKLLISDFKRKTFRSSKSGCKSDFERYMNLSIPNKLFRQFLDELIKLKILEFFDNKKTITGFVPAYVINEKKAIKEIDEMDLGNKFYMAYFNNKFSL